MFVTPFNVGHHCYRRFRAFVSTETPALARHFGPFSYFYVFAEPFVRSEHRIAAHVVHCGSYAVSTGLTRGVLAGRWNDVLGDSSRSGVPEAHQTQRHRYDPLNSM